MHRSHLSFIFFCLYPAPPPNRVPLRVTALTSAPNTSPRYSACIQRRLYRRCIPAGYGAAYSVASACRLRLPLRVKASHSGAEYVASVGSGADSVASASAAAAAVPRRPLFFRLLFSGSRVPLRVTALTSAPCTSPRYSAYIQRRLIRRCIPARSGAAFAVAFAYLRRLPLQVIAPRSGAALPLRLSVPYVSKKRESIISDSQSFSLVVSGRRFGGASPPSASAPPASPRLEQPRRQPRRCCSSSGSFLPLCCCLVCCSCCSCCSSCCVTALVCVPTSSLFPKKKRIIVPRGCCSCCYYRYFYTASKPEKGREYSLFRSYRRRFLPASRQKNET